jgi:hypothetical protein
MSGFEKVKRLRFELASATRRLEWAREEARAKGETPAITRIMEESDEECLRLAKELAPPLLKPRKRKAVLNRPHGPGETKPARLAVSLENQTL